MDCHHLNIVCPEFHIYSPLKTTFHYVPESFQSHCPPDTQTCDFSNLQGHISVSLALLADSYRPGPVISLLSNPSYLVSCCLHSIAVSLISLKGSAIVSVQSKLHVACRKLPALNFSPVNRYPEISRTASFKERKSFLNLLCQRPGLDRHSVVRN